MKVAVFGLGYVGCVTAACLARNGHTVVGVDVNEDKVAMINNGASPIVEPGLGDLLAAVTAAGRLSATTDAAEAVAATDLALVAVGTPSKPNGQPSFEAIARVGEDIGAAVAARDGRRLDGDVLHGRLREDLGDRDRNRPVPVVVVGGRDVARPGLPAAILRPVAGQLAGAVQTVHRSPARGGRLE